MSIPSADGRLPHEHGPRNYDRILDVGLGVFGLGHHYDPDDPGGTDPDPIPFGRHAITKPETQWYLGLFPRETRQTVALVFSEASLAKPYHESRGVFGLSYGGLHIRILSIDPNVEEALRDAAQNMEAELGEPVKVSVSACSGA